MSEPTGGRSFGGVSGQSLWISKEKALEVTGWKRPWLDRSVQTGRVEKRLSKKTGRNGKPLPEYKVSSLPQEAQKKYAAMFEDRVPVAPPLPVAQSSLALVPVGQVEPIRPRVQQLSDADDQTAEERLTLIRPLLEYDADPQRFENIARSKSELAKTLAAQHEISERTLWRWHNRFKKAGLPALANGTRRDREQSRWAQQNGDAAIIAAALYLGEQRLSVRHIYRAIETRRAEEGSTAGEIPSYRALLNFLGSIPEPIRLRAREGKRKYEASCARYVSRDYPSTLAGQIYVSDHMVHDVYVQNDLFGERDFRHMRLRLTLIMDFRSRRPVGYAWSEEGSSRSIVTALRHTLTSCGPARFFYCDNGKDYKKIAGTNSQHGWLEGNLPTPAQSVLLRLGMDVIHCIARHPQSKHVEREFGTFHAQFDKLWRTYTGEDAVRVPDMARAALERHKKLLASGDTHDSDLPKASTFIRRAIKWIEEEYVHMPHSGEGMHGRSPDQIWNEYRWEQQPPPPSQDDLALLLTERTKRLVRNDQVELNSVAYMPSDPASSAELHLRNGSQVVVAYDPCDPDVAIALDDAGHRIAWLSRKELAGMYALETGAAADRSRALVADSLAERRRLAKATVNAIDGVQRTARRIGYKSRLAQMAEDDHTLPAAVGDHITERPRSEERPRRMQTEDLADLMVAAMGGER